jgi:hypothetical protein
MTLLIACLLIYVGDLHYGWYVLAAWLWLAKNFVKFWGAFTDVGDS